MLITQLQIKDSLLDYALLTTPEPLQASPTTGPPSIGALTFVISCPIVVGSVTVKQVLFDLPVGNPKAPDATDLTDTATGMSASVSSSGAAKWQIGPGPMPGSFLLTPAPGTPGVIDGQGLTVTITNIQLSAIVGTSLIVILEVATDNASAPIARKCEIAVPKFPYGFITGNFAASAPMVNNGSTVGLSWIGSIGPTYTMVWGTQSQDVTTVNQWTSPALTDTTMFILEVIAQQGGQTVKLYYSVTVIVADPDIIASSLNVLNGAVVGTTLQVAGAISGFGTVPIGSVIAYAGTITSTTTLAAQGWLLCDGTAISRSTYGGLFAVIGTQHGAGDGSTTFNLPDHRGRFLRGTDHGAGRDPDIALRTPANTGGVSGDATGSIQPWASGKPANTALTTDVQGDHTHTVNNVPTDNSSYRIAGSSLSKWNSGSVNTGTAGAHSHTISGGGDNETRPVNAYVDHLIRFQ